MVLSRIKAPVDRCRIVAARPHGSTRLLFGRDGCGAVCPERVTGPVADHLGQLPGWVDRIPFVYCRYSVQHSCLPMAKEQSVVAVAEPLDSYLCLYRSDSRGVAGDDGHD